MIDQPFEVRPAVFATALKLIIGCIFFIGIGVVLLVSGENILGGVACLVIFLFGGGYAIYRTVRRKVSCILDEEGIELIYPQGNARVPWGDVERFGSMDDSVGIRLACYDRYLNGMPPALTEFTGKTLTALKFVAGAALVLRFVSDKGVPLWSQLPSGGEIDAIKQFGKLGSVAEVLLFSRQMYGYDLLISKQDLDRSPEAFAKLLEDYRSRNVG